MIEKPASFNANDCKGANNRAYYAIFHALDGNSYRSHKETISNFNADSTIS